MECSNCGAENKLLFKTISKNGIIKVCNQCLGKLKSPIINDSSRVDFENQDEATKGATSTNEMYSKEEGDWASMITDKVRVYKGGSWRDRVYWLNPATRRFLDQEEARDDIGFRCAMTEISSPKGKGY